MTEPRDATPEQAVGWNAVSTLLRLGTLAAVVVIGLGLTWALWTATPGPSDLTVVELIARGGPDALIALGLLALTLIPIAVVSVAAVVFARLGERRSVFIAAGVLVLLVVSLVASAVLGAAA